MEQKTLAFLVIVALVSPGVTGLCGDLYYAAKLALARYEVCASIACENSVADMPRDCAYIKAQGHTTSGLYAVYYLDGTTWTPVRVYCDMETAGGGWLVFQRRQDGSEDFYRNWKDYSIGFGDQTGEFCLGNENLHMLTSGGQYRLRIDLEDFKGETRYAEYTSFSVGNASSKYTLSVSGFSGDAGDALRRQNGMKFSTKDQDNNPDDQDCATLFKGAWWYERCHDSNLNGAYLGGPHTSFADGVEWRQWKGYRNSLKFTDMKFKPA